MKQIVLTVVLTFADKISDDKEIKEVVQNVANALKNEAETHGLAPANSDTYTTEIEVATQFMEGTIHCIL